MKFTDKYRDEIKFVVFLIAYAIIAYFLHIPCLIKFVTGVSCPGCGMTRAFFSCFHLDFHSAFVYHPLWCVLIPLVVLLWFLRKKGYKLAFNIVGICIIVLFLAVYLYRMFFLDGNVVTFEPKNGLFYRLAMKIKTFFISN